MPTWNNGEINWSLVNGTTNVVQVMQNATDAAIRVYVWRNEMPGETAYQAFLQFARQFDYSAAGTNIAACVGQEWSPTGTQLIQERAFVISPDEVDIYGGDT